MLANVNKIRSALIMMKAAMHVTASERRRRDRAGGVRALQAAKTRIERLELSGVDQKRVQAALSEMISELED
jgi:hypothetical protein